MKTDDKTKNAGLIQQANEIQARVDQLDAVPENQMTPRTRRHIRAMRAQIKALRQLAGSLL